ncbi:MAG: MFS transporter [Actinomycetota bacterium]
MSSDSTAVVAPASAPPFYLDPEVHRRRWIVLAAMCLPLVMVVMSVAGMNVALPSIQRELSASAGDLVWTVDAYALVFAGLLLTAGALGDRFGRKGALLVGLGIFAAGLTIGGVAGSPAQLIFGRAVMGAGAALVMPATLSTITVVFPPQERRRAIAIWAAFAGAGGSFGPVVSGLLLRWFWWGSTLLALLPVVALTALVIALVCPQSKDDAATPLDPVGAVLSLAGLTGLLFAIIEGPQFGWTDGRVLGAAAAGIAVLSVFLIWERRSKHPMLPIYLFGDLRFRVGSGVITAVFFIMFGWFFTNTLYLQFVRGYSALLASLAMLPFPLAMILVAPRSARLGERFGSGRVITAGFSVIALGFGMLALFGPSTPYLMLGLAFVVLGSGMGITAAPATGNIMSAVPAGKAGVGSAVNDTTREFGGALGIAVFGTVVSSLYRSGIDVGALGLSGDAARVAQESVGAATTFARGLPHGGALFAQSIASYGSAFRVVNIATALLAAAAAVAVAKFFSREREAQANPALEAVLSVGRSPGA